MGRKNREYTYEEYKKAMELLKRGYGLSETCRILGWPETKVSTLHYWKHGIIPSAVKKVLGIRKQREYSYKDYKRVMDMLREGYKPLEISMTFGIPINTVRNWKNGRIPPAAKWIAEPSNELAYVIGVLHGDGCVYIARDKHGYQYVIKLATIDPEFAEIFSRVISRLLSVKYHKPYWSKKEKKWLIVYKSKAFYKWYKKCEKQGLQGFKPYIEYSKETVKYYLKGLFDSEGNNNGNKQIRLYNTRKELLKYVQYLLKEYFDIIATGPYLQRKTGNIKVINGEEYIVKHDDYNINIHRKQHVQKFLEEIGFSIVRKQLGLKKHEKVFIKGLGYIQPYELVKLGLFKLPFNDSQ